MDLYNFHTNPESLNHYNVINDTIPEYFWEKYKNNKEELKKREKYIAKSSGYSFKYAKKTSRPFPAGEEAISKVPSNAFEYAKFILKAPFPKGEEAIASIGVYAFEYARDILKGPFPKGEDAIAKVEYLATKYANFILKGPFPKGEEAIATDAGSAFFYARDILKGPFPAGEKTMAESASKQYAQYYAEYVLKADFFYNGKLIAKGE